MVLTNGVVMSTFQLIQTDAATAVGSRAPTKAVVLGMQGACLFVIAAWNFRAEIEAKIRRLRPSGGDVFLCYFPQVEIS